MDDADAAFLGQRNREAALRHRIHGRGDERDVDAGSPRVSLCANVDVTGVERGACRNEQDIVKRQGLADDPLVRWSRRFPCATVLRMGSPLRQARGIGAHIPEFHEHCIRGL